MLIVHCSPGSFLQLYLPYSFTGFKGKDTYDLRQPAFMEIPSDKRGSEKFPLKSTEENLFERGMNNFTARIFL